MDDHEGYITWSEHTVKTLESNGAMRNGSGKGAIKTGPALLGGLLRCGNCGRKMFVAYSGKGGRVPRYACNGGRTDRGNAQCQSLGGARVDQAVAEVLLQAIQPAGIGAAFLAAEHAEGE